MHIGLDFDNTLAGYDHVFTHAAMERGWVPPDFSGTKKTLRDAVRRLEDGEVKWQILQAEVYGPRMDEAKLIDGVADALAAFRVRGLPVSIVSHKTRYAGYDRGRVDLRAAARRWMEAQGFFAPSGFGLDPQRVYFEDTRAAKIARLQAIGCTHFVDDLEEVFRDPGFPRDVAAHLFAPADGPLLDGPFRPHRRWAEITDALLA